MRFMMNVNTSHANLKQITFDQVKKTEDVSKVIINATLNGASYEFVVVEADIQKLSPQELQNKFGEQFTNMCKVAKVIHLKSSESLEQKADTLSLKGRKGKMETHTLSPQLKITLPKRLPARKLAKISTIYQAKKPKTAAQASTKQPMQPQKAAKSVPVVTLSNENKAAKMLPQDVVCEFSQGRIGDIRKKLNIEADKDDDDNLTSQACTYISMEAVKSIFSKGLPKNEVDIYTLINEGAIKYLKHKKDNSNPQEYFKNVYELPENKKDKEYLISALNLPTPKAFGAGSFEDATEFTYPVNAEMNLVFADIREMVEDSANPVCAVLTTANINSNATVVIAFDENKRPVLFNSHGETVNGKIEGASLRRFNDLDDLSAYIKKTFYKDQDGTFQLMLLQKVPTS